MNKIIILNLIYTKSRAYNFTVKCYGKKINQDGSMVEYATPRAVSGCGYDKVDTAKSIVLDELFTQQELEHCFKNKIYGVMLSSLTNKYIIDGGCGSCDNIARSLNYEVLTCKDCVIYQAK